MSSAAAYLVVRRDDGFGDVFPLTIGQRYNMGRATTNRIVLKDDLCSREHAEVYNTDGKWHVRDLNSLNGTQINGARVGSDEVLSPGVEIHLGRTNLLFVENMAQLPAVPVGPAPVDNMLIKKRLGTTRFLTPPPVASQTASEGSDLTPADQHHGLSRDLSLLYRLALAMGSAANYQELVWTVLNGLLEGVPADAGAILAVKEGHDPEPIAHCFRDQRTPSYAPISTYVSREVLTTREAILAEDVSRDRHLRNRESLTEIGATSLICAPVIFSDRVLGLIHLYCTDVHKVLDAEDLEFAMAVAKQLGAATHQIQRQASLRAENRSLRQQLRIETELVGVSQTMKELEATIARVADTHATVLIRGESGTGKELVARAIHFSSKRRDGPFICLNCAAIAETLLESELFGHEKGAFTGATEKKIGKFEAADHGTILLDEIGEMNPGTQAKLLRILEGHPFERVGGSAPIRTDVRVVASTNKQLEQALQAGMFRRDLFYRLQVVEIRIPPLREHLEDVVPLAEHFLRRYALETGRRVLSFTPEAFRKLQQYHWPGNVRELRNVVERAVALGLGPVLDAQDLWLSSLEADGPVPLLLSNQTYEVHSLDEIERQHIFRTLQHTDWNKSQAAAILKIERSTLDRKIKLYDLKR